MLLAICLQSERVNTHFGLFTVDSTHIIGFIQFRCKSPVVQKRKILK